VTHSNHPSIGRALLFAALLMPLAPRAAAAQEDGPAGLSFGISGELVSQYVWRGLRLHDKPSLQPDVYVSKGELTLGVWSSWPLKGDVNEMDTYLSWDKELPAGDLSLTVTDYFLPYLGTDSGWFTNFDGVVNGEATGAHTVEFGAEFTPSAVPLTFMAAWNAYNDPDHALYGAVSSEVSVPMLFDLGGELGFLLKDSQDYYGGSAGLFNVGVHATRSFTLGVVEPYVTVGYTRNAAVKENYWVFAVGF
jgi:hypothetical protein